MVDNESGVMSELVFIRHAESMNNCLYRTCREGAPCGDAKAFLALIQERRAADPAITDVGERQALHLAEYLVTDSVSPLGTGQSDVLIVSPMKRTLQTISPTLNLLRSQHSPVPKIIVHGGWFEQGGLHHKNSPPTAMLGLAKADMLELLGEEEGDGVEFVGFEGTWARVTDELNIRAPQAKKQKIEQPEGWHINRHEPYAGARARYVSVRDGAAVKQLRNGF